MPAFDLKQVGKLFNDTVSAIRDDTPDMDALEPQAIAWLKSARYKLMRDVEEAYYELERTRDTPMEQPAWALDPAESLYLRAQLPPLLEPFRTAITQNLEILLRDCGFQVRAAYPSLGWVAFTIHFPAQLAAPPQALRTLHVEDDFSARPAGRGGGGGRKRKKGGAGSFAAGNSARLLIEARGGSAAHATVNTEEEDEDEDSDDQGVKEEEDEDQGRRRRLRSTTRASSAATLRSEPDTGGRLRGGNRKSKRVKKEEED
ncbi:hypothetical protein DFH08DRAFT_933983 [Mycena albidolilacea]|uniref:Uncharacterized protein n=1 Tax=Mycena albidolilacea TaxID=1033008 RepID=A0AAD7AC05_9AGAR|nr:hypothetical protein DFH08DRAFT_933983 [Mycena albidolilacea]